MELKVIGLDEKDIFNEFMAWGPKGHVLQSWSGEK